MDCAEFKSNWHAYMADSVDSNLKDEMESHAKICQICGSDLNEFREITATVESIANDKKLADDLSESVARQTMKSQTPRPVSSTVAAATVTPFSSGMLLPIVFGVLLGNFFFSGSNSEPSLVEKVMQQEFFSNGFGRGSSSNPMLGLMMANEFAGSNMSQRSFIGLPQITNVVRILFLVSLLNWVARNKAWDHYFPNGVPSTASAARLACLLATILGVARCSFSLYLGLQAMSAGGAKNLESWMLTSLHFIDQLWAIAFWLTMMLVLYCLANELVPRLFKKQATPT